MYWKENNQHGNRWITPHGWLFSQNTTSCFSTFYFQSRLSWLHKSTVTSSLPCLQPLYCTSTYRIIWWSRVCVNVFLLCPAHPGIHSICDTHTQCANVISDHTVRHVHSPFIVLARPSCIGGGFAALHTRTRNKPLFPTCKCKWD